MDRHEEQIEHTTSWADGRVEWTADRRVCGFCWREDTEGRPRRVTWPCDAVKARNALQEINGLVSGGICAMGSRGKDVYIRQIGQVVDRFVAESATPGAGSAGDE